MTQRSPAGTATDWILCPGCATPVYGKRWTANLSVCPDCGHHDRLTARQRLGQLLDQDEGELLAVSTGEHDPLEFVDQLPYPQRLARARAATGLDEAMLCARGRILGAPVVVAVMDFGFLGGSLGAAVGDRVVLAAETALEHQIPLLVVTASGGARMQEGAISLMQMARTSASLARLDRAGILTVSLITDPTFGGVAASYATLSDVIVAEPGARLGFAGRRVIEQTLRQELPPGFQTAEFLADRGFVDLIVPRQRLRYELARLLRAGGAGRGDAVGGPALPERVVIRDPARLPATDAWEQVRAARDLTRPTTLEYFALALDDFQELHGDRLGDDCPAVVGGTAWLDGRPLMVVGHQKGHTPAEVASRGFGMATPAGNRKAARLMRLAEKLGLPVVTLVDTPGAFPGATAEEQGQAYAIAENLRLMAALRVPSMAVVVGEGGSGGALALATANRVLMMANSVYSVISPEGCAAILWKGTDAVPRAARALRMTARDLLSLGVVDGVVPEPIGGSGADHLASAQHLRAALRECLGELAALSAEQLVEHRRRRFERFGVGDLRADGATLTGPA